VDLNDHAVERRDPLVERYQDAAAPLSPLGTLHPLTVCT
jgi:hypothetical protein